EGEIITMSELFHFERRGIDANNKIIGVYRPTGAIPACMDELKRRGIDLDVDFFDPDNEVDG
ncbi:MAG: CpaF family protein, partial [Gammaproteobacteria bacterium]|nr:CpaF family protein [Gammaproteobacteria bacterium]